MIALSVNIGDLVRWVIGLFVYDLLRWAWRADQPAPPSWPATCDWCGARCRRDEPPAEDLDPGIRSVWWCSLRCQVEHWHADDRVSPPSGMRRNVLDNTLTNRSEYPSS